MLSDCLYSINWYYFSSAEGTHLSRSEYIYHQWRLPRLISLAKNLFPKPLRTTTIFEYQARQSTAETVILGNASNYKRPSIPTVV